MKINDFVHGFRVKARRDLDDIGAVMWEMTYEKSGTELVYLEREDMNKSFAIGFKTIPDDDTGVFHIIEHSVLCGSEKYPSKDPFVELLKGSMQTFLNAMTYNDKTVYPVSSRNEKDFLNLVDVYMDAVLHPMILKTPEIFYQEGWHYEYDESSDKLSYKGVVFNEMKGVYSSADEVMNEQIMKALYPDVCYGKDSGGDPTKIPDLTYENFLAAHAKYYHPSNARIFLDGTMDLDKVLARLDGFLSPYQKLSMEEENLFQSPVMNERRCEYELSEGENEEGKVRAAYGYAVGTYQDDKKQLALQCIIDALAGSNEAPLKKALLSEGLCEDVNLYLLDGIAQPSLIMEIRNTTNEKLSRIESVTKSIIEEAVNKGIDRERLVAALNRMEFRLAERDYGSLPRGLVFALTSFESWLYGGDPAQNLCFVKTVNALREALATNEYESILRACMLENNHTGKVVMTPSKTLAKQRLADEEERLLRARAAMDDRAIEALKAQNEKLVLWQSTEDTPQILAKLPTLSLSDIPKETEKLPVEVKTVKDTKILAHDIETSGIDYFTLRFNCSDLDKEELFDLSLLTTLISNLSTRSMSALELENAISTHLGAFSVSTETVVAQKDLEKTTVHAIVNVSALQKNRDRVLALTPEILLCTRFDEYEQILNLVRQSKLSLEEGFASSGHTSGIGRASAAFSAASAAAEHLGGFEYLCKLKSLEENFEVCFEALAKRLSAMLSRIFTRDRLILSLTGSYDEDFVGAMIEAFPKSGITPPSISGMKPFGVFREGIVTPSQVSYANAAWYYDDPKLYGAFLVARNILSYEYLWNEIRVKGGAYGAGFLARRGGLCGFYSYRDPNATRSLDIYRAAPDFLRKFAVGGRIPDKFIIGAVASTDPLRTPRQMGAQSDIDYLTGYTDEDAQALRQSMLSLTADGLRAVADQLETIVDCAAVSVIGAKEKLTACRENGQIASMREI